MFGAPPAACARCLLALVPSSCDLAMIPGVHQGPCRDTVASNAACSDAPWEPDDSAVAPPAKPTVDLI